MLADWPTLVEHESPSRDKAAARRLALGRLAGRALGGVVGVVVEPEAGRRRSRCGPLRQAGRRRAPALVLGHFDTVWPLGTLARMPVPRSRTAGLRARRLRHEGQPRHARIRALEAIRALGLDLPRPVDRAVHLRRGDRQPGLAAADRGRGRRRARTCWCSSRRSPTAASRPRARESAGSPSRSRAGRPTPASSPRRASAPIVELAHQVLRIHALNDPAAARRSTSASSRGAPRPTSSPAEATAQRRRPRRRPSPRPRPDRAGAPGARAGHARDAHRRRGRLQPAADGALAGAVAALFERARDDRPRRSASSWPKARPAAAATATSPRRWASPRSTAWAPWAAGAHADDEHIVIDSLPERAALLAALLLNCRPSRMSPNGPARMNDEITIRRAETLADYRACQEAQRQAWGITEEGYVVPIATMVGAKLHGGLVLGAFLPDGEAVGMSFALPRPDRGADLPLLAAHRRRPRYQRGASAAGSSGSARTCPRGGAGPDRLGLRSPPGRQRPLQPGPAGRHGRALRREHVRAPDRRPERRRADRPPHRRVGARNQRRARPLPDPERLASLPRSDHGPVENLAASSSSWRADPIGRRAPALLEMPLRSPTSASNRPNWPKRGGWPSGRPSPAAFALAFVAIGFVRDDSSGERRGFYLTRSPCGRVGLSRL